jgi:hypothetical protein
MSTAGHLGGGAGDPGAPTINVKKRRRRAIWEVSELEIQERLPSTLRNIDGGPPDPRGGIRSPSGIRNVRCDQHRHDRKKVILLMGPSLPALSSVMADNP